MPAAVACLRCGAPVFAEDRFCGSCGAPRTPTPIPEESGSGAGETSAYGSRLLATLRRATLGEYEIRGEIGRGGMAAVYLAYDLRLNRKVAIKLMLPELAFHEGMEDRFKREARTAAKLDHPNIVVIYSVRDDAELLYFVMKFIEGASLEQVVRRYAPMPLAVAQHLLVQLAGALQYAHDEGVVHRDVKPANVLVDRRGNALVTDFGIAKATESPKLTRTGSVIGTPAYMSPEQCVGSEQTHASDQYSLGVVAYELIAGRPPFVGPMIELQWAHVKTNPPPLRHARPDCPPGLADAVMRMLAKDPADRFPSLQAAIPLLGMGLIPGDESPRRRLAEMIGTAAPTPSDGIAITPPSPIPQSRATPKATPPAAPVGEPAPKPAAPKPAAPKPAAAKPDTPKPAAPEPAAPKASASPAVPAPPPVALAPPIAPRPEQATPAERVTVTTTPQRRIPVPLLIVNGVAVVVIAGTILFARSGSKTAANQSAATNRSTAIPAVRPAPPPEPVEQPARQAARADSTSTATSATEPPPSPPPTSPPTSGSSTLGTARPEAARLLVTGRTPVQLERGQASRIGLRATTTDGATVALPGSVSWSSDDPAIATVSSNGTVIGRAEGSTNVTATAGRLTTSVEVIVSRPTPNAIAVSPRTASLKPGDATSLTARVRDRAGLALPYTVVWRSSNSSVATVDVAGSVRGVRQGEAIIVATAGRVSDTVRVSVVASTIAATPPTTSGNAGGTTTRSAEERAPDRPPTAEEADAALVAAAGSIAGGFARGQLGILSATSQFAKSVRDDQPEVVGALQVQRRTVAAGKIEGDVTVPLRWKTFTGGVKTGSVVLRLTLEQQSGGWRPTAARNLNNP